MPNATRADINALHRYFIWSDRMRVHFDQVLQRKLDAQKPFSEKEKHVFDIETFMYMSLWYGTFYVLVEGWKELGLSDPEIDKLLVSENTSMLRRYRNGVFHYQRNYVDDRFQEIMRDGIDSVTWIRELREAFSRWFLLNLKVPTFSDQPHIV